MFSDKLWLVLEDTFGSSYLEALGIDILHTNASLHTILYCKVFCVNGFKNKVFALSVIVIVILRQITNHKCKPLKKKKKKWMIKQTSQKNWLINWFGLTRAVVTFVIDDHSYGVSS